MKKMLVINIDKEKDLSQIIIIVFIETQIFLKVKIIMIVMIKEESGKNKITKIAKTIIKCSQENKKYSNLKMMKMMMIIVMKVMIYFDIGRFKQF